jgi:hypothetical protein
VNDYGQGLSGITGGPNNQESLFDRRLFVDMEITHEIVNIPSVHLDTPILNHYGILLSVSLSKPRKRTSINASGYGDGLYRMPHAQ